MSPHKNVKNPRTDKAVIVLRILLYVDLDGVSKAIVADA